MSDQNLSGLQKAALLLKSLPARVVDRVLQHMKPEQAALIKAEIARVSARKDLDQVMTQVLDEAAQVLNDAHTKKAGPGKPALHAPPAGPEKREPAKPVEPSKVDIRLADTPVEETKKSPLEALSALSPELVAQALDSETTRTIALLMNGLDVDVAGGIYKRLTPAKRKEVSARFTEHAAVSDELLQRIADGVVRKCAALQAATGAKSTEPGAREKRTAALLRGLDRVERMEMLGVLQASDAELAGRVKALLYQFEDILRMQNLSVQKLLAEIDMKTLAMAVNGVAENLREKLLTNLSKRAQESLREEIELSGAVPSARTHQAQQTIAETIARLDERGDLVMIE
jgi:flagellar motor switch protein FliG